MAVLKLQFVIWQIIPRLFAGQRERLNVLIQLFMTVEWHTLEFDIFLFQDTVLLLNSPIIDYSLAGINMKTMLLLALWSHGRILDR